MDYSVKADAPYVPDDSMRRKVADYILAAPGDVGSLKNKDERYEHRDGSVRLSTRGRASMGGVGTYCFNFGECGCSGCGCNRLERPECRRRYRHVVTERTVQTLEQRRPAERSVRLVTIGSGALLTDFEILLSLWARGLRIEQVVAIDQAYKKDDPWNGEYDRALKELAIFFAPARVFAFSSAADYVGAAERDPGLYAKANIFLYCDAAAVPHDAFSSAACAALLPGLLAFELANTGRGHGERGPPLDAYLPAELKPMNDSGRYSMKVMRAAANGAGGGGWPGAGGGGGGGGRTTTLEDVEEPLIDKADRGGASFALREAAVAHLQKTARARAAENGMRLYKVVYPFGPRMPVRSAPSRDAACAGSRTVGEEVIVDEVGDDGWVRLSSELDTYAAYQNYSVQSAREGLWMLTQASDVGELLRELALDENGVEIDDTWLPDVV